MNTVRKILTKLRRGSWYPFYYTFYTRCRVDPHTILLESRHGKSLESSIYALLKELTKDLSEDPAEDTTKSLSGYRADDGARFRIVLCADRAHYGRIRDKLKRAGLSVTRLVRYGSPAYYHELSRAGFLINDISFPGRFVKKPGQKYLNVWHGTPLKKMGRDDLPERAFMGNMMRNFLMADYLLYPNRHMEEVMVSSFMLDRLYRGRVLHTGYPRNDIFFDSRAGKELKETLGYGQKRLYAYLPTYRGYDGAADPSAVRQRLCYLDQLDGLLEDDEVVLYKPHPLEAGDSGLFFRHILPFPCELDTNHVLNACDALITDYSSVFFDFANTGRPVYLFTYDQEAYDRDRGTYLEPDELPFPSAADPVALAGLLHGEGSCVLPTAWRERFLTWENGHGSRDALTALLTGQAECPEISVRTDKKPAVLLYAGNLAQNGVTSAFFRLYQLLDHAACHYFVCFRTDSVREDPSRVDRLPPDAFLLPMASEMNLDPVTAAAQAIYLKWGFCGLGIGRRLERAYRTEWEKHFPGVRFHHIIHYNGYENYVLSLFRNAPCPVSVWVHSNMEKEIQTRRIASRPLLKDFYRRCHRIFCVSDNGLLSAFHISGRHSGILRVPNCQDPERIRQKATLSLEFDRDTDCSVSLEELKCILLSGRPCFLYLGRFSPEKGPLELLDAFGIFGQRHPEALLIMAGGGGPLYGKTVSQAKESPVSDRIVVIRSLSNPMPLLAACRLLLVPSRYEGCPVVPYEADFLNVPCACADVPGCRELMHRWGGYLFPPTTEGICTAMEDGLAGRIPPMHIDPGPDNRKILETFYRTIGISG